MMKRIYSAVMFIILAGSVVAQTPVKTDPVAENMLAYQRHNGGWTKAVNEIKVDYNKPLSADERQAVLKDSVRDDATIDNNSTYREIVYLVKAYEAGANPAYLKAVEKGLDYLLTAQYPNGGWPQYYPDASLYRSQVTFNDNAMINVMTLLYDVQNGANGFNRVKATYAAKAKRAVENGIACILKTQIRVDGKLTGWNQQYNKTTLAPEMARKFELVGLTASETTGILEFLLKMPDPSPEIKTSVSSGVNWLNQVKITGYKTTSVKDTTQASKRDVILVAGANSTIWARYYDIGTNKPFFSGRDSQKKFNLSEIENERRVGYAWYGNWPAKLLETDYPAWAKKWMNR